MASRLTESAKVVKHHWLGRSKIGNWLETTMIVSQWKDYQQICPKRSIAYTHLLCYVSLKPTVSWTEHWICCTAACRVWGRLERAHRIDNQLIEKLERGCPQGSVPGPLLWNIFHNDLSYNVDSRLSMHADDHQIYVKGKDMWQESATLATNWHDSNLLQGNLKKYQMMNIRIKSVNYGDKTSVTVIGKDIVL